MATNNIRLIIVSGISGSGTSTALRALEDIGFFSVNNLPDALLDSFVEELLLQSKKTSEQQHRCYALVVDCRDQAAVERILNARSVLVDAGILVELLFLDCQDEVVASRFRQTRRPHPLICSGLGSNAAKVGGASIKTVAEALERERLLLADLRLAADRIVDTSMLTPHELRRVAERFAEHRQLHVEVAVLSFGFKYGVPQDIDLLVDVRFLPNPYFDEELRDKTGLDAKVRDRVFSVPDAQEFVDRYFSLLEFLLSRYEKEGKRYLTLAVGCTGGKHRSVAVGQRFVEQFAEQGREVLLRHRDIERG